MTDAKPPDPQADANSSPQTADLNADAAAKGERLGTILMGVAIAGIVVLIADVALKGRLLAPLFALLPAPKSPPAETPDAPPRPAGE